MVAANASDSRLTKANVQRKTSFGGRVSAIVPRMQKSDTPARQPNCRALRRWLDGGTSGSTLRITPRGTPAWGGSHADSYTWPTGTLHSPRGHDWVTFPAWLTICSRNWAA